MFRRLRLVARHLSPLIVTLPAAAQAVRVNAPLARGVAGDVVSVRISPDGARVVFRADQEEDEVYRLYAVPIEGGPVKRLTPTLTAGGDVTDAEIGPRSRTAVYRADQDTDEVFELYSVGLVGHLPGTKLSGALVTGGDVQAFWIAPFTEDVVYLADQEVDQRVELYRVPIAGGPVTKLNAPLAAGTRVDLARITPDGTRVLYRTLDAGGLFDLWSVPLAGGPAVQLDPPLESPRTFEITPDSQDVVFQGSVSGSKLFRTSVLGGPPTELATGARGFKLLPGAQAVLYLAFGQQVRDQLFLVPLHGGAPRQLTEHDSARVSGVLASADGRWIEYTTEFGDANGPVYTLPLTGGAGSMIDDDGDEMFLSGITPDSRLLLYTAFGGTHGGQPALFAAPVGGGTPMRLTDRDLAPVAFTPDSTRVLALAGDIFLPTLDLLVVSLEDGSAVQLNPPLVDGGTVVGSPLLSPDGSRVVYLAEQDLDGVVGLYSVAIDGGPPVRLNGPLSTDGIAGDVRGVQVSPNGRRIVYLADQDTDEVLELYSAPAAGGPPVRLNGPLVRNGDVVDGQFRISRDSTRVVYLADERIDGVRELFSVPIDGGSSVCLNGPGTAGVSRFELAPDGARVVFASQTLGPNLAELFSAPIEGGPIADLSGSLADLETVQAWDLVPDGSGVAFAARRAGDGVEAELYSVPLEGGTALRISPTPVAGGGVTGLAVLADSSAVVYSAALDVADSYDLWWTPLAGGPSERLSGTIAPDQDVFLFEASPDAHHVVYRVDRFLQTSPLHAVSLPDFTRTRLSPPIVAGGTVLEFKISPDSARVVYRADQVVDNDVELFSVPIAGGPATRLNGPLVHNGDVGGFQVSPGSARVVYSADQLANDVFELFSVPIAGGPSARLNAPLPNGGDVSTFAIDDSGRSVVYQADQLVNDRQELFVVPVTGGAAPIALNPPLPPGSDVEGPPPSPFFVQPFVLAGRLLLFHADLTTDGVYDLYRVVLPLLGPPRARHR